MSRDITDLTAEYQLKVKNLLQACEDSGYPMRAFFTLRDPFEQGKL